MNMEQMGRVKAQAQRKGIGESTLWDWIRNDPLFPQDAIVRLGARMTLLDTEKFDRYFAEKCERAVTASAAKSSQEHMRRMAANSKDARRKRKEAEATGASSVARRATATASEKATTAPGVIPISTLIGEAERA